MIFKNIGFGNGCFYPLYKNNNDYLSTKFIDLYQVKGTNLLQIQCLDENMIDSLLAIDKSYFSFFKKISIHAPCHYYLDNSSSNNIFQKFVLLSKKIPIYNFVFHPDTVVDWNVFKKYSHLPISVENMDNLKDNYQTVDEISAILDIYNFNLTLDLQHCFTVDNSMRLAIDFQKKFKGRIVEYHLSGYDAKYLHYPLYFTKQDIILDSILYPNLPTIIESTFNQIGNHLKEFDYINSY